MTSEKMTSSTNWMTSSPVAVKETTLSSSLYLSPFFALAVSHSLFRFGSDDLKAFFTILHSLRKMAAFLTVFLKWRTYVIM